MKSPAVESDEPTGVEQGDGNRRNDHRLAGPRAPASWALRIGALVVLVASPARSTARGPGNAPTPPLS